MLYQILILKFNHLRINYLFIGDLFLKRGFLRENGLERLLQRGHYPVIVPYVGIVVKAHKLVFPFPDRFDGLPRLHYGKMGFLAQGNKEEKNIGERYFSKIDFSGKTRSKESRRMARSDRYVSSSRCTSLMHTSLRKGF